MLDTPEFFWSAPDSMQNLYKRVCEVRPGGARGRAGGRAGGTARRSGRDAPLAPPAPCAALHRPNRAALCRPTLQYMEYDTRVEVLNNRFAVLQEMLDM